MTFQELLQGLTTAGGTKAIVSLVLGYLAHWLLPISHFFAAVVFLVIADFITGVWAAVRKGRRISSYGFRRTIVKLLMYMLAILCGFVMQAIFLPNLALVYWMAMFIAVTEFLSNLENIEKITGIRLSLVIRMIIVSRIPLLSSAVKKSKLDDDDAAGSDS